MKNFFNIIKVLTIVLFMATSAKAEQYISSFGFSGDLGDSWLVMSIDSLKNKKDLFKSPELVALSPEVIKRVSDIIASGKMELLYRKSEDKEYADNINVFLLSPKKVELIKPKKTCEAIVKGLKTKYNRDTDNTVYSCGYTEVNALPMVMAVMDGIIIGTTSYFYQFHSPKGTVQITATCRKGRCDVVAGEIENMFKKIKFDK